MSGKLYFYGIKINCSPNKKSPKKSFKVERIANGSKNFESKFLNFPLVVFPADLLSQELLCGDEEGLHLVLNFCFIAKKNSVSNFFIFQNKKCFKQESRLPVVYFEWTLCTCLLAEID